MKEKHDFVITTFLKPTYCDCCSRLLWGMSRQGLSCTVCNANIHKSCQNLVLVSCSGPSIKNLTLFEKEKKTDFKDFKEPLNLLTTTPKNFTRLVSKISPIVQGQEELIKILEWVEPIKSSAVLLLYILTCLYPWLILFFPTFYIFYILFNASPTESSSQYMKNMQFIQNHMKMGSDLIDYINEFIDSLVNSKNGNLILLYSTLASTFAAIVCNYIPIKFNWICLILGVLVLSSHSLIFKYFTWVIKKVCFKHLKTLPILVSKGVKTVGKNEKVVKVYENQRWWAGLGWIPFLLKNERTGWTDESGTVNSSHINEYQPIPFYKWKQDEWSIYQDWSQVGVDAQGNFLFLTIRMGIYRQLVAGTSAKNYSRVFYTLKMLDKNYGICLFAIRDCIFT